MDKIKFQIFNQLKSNKKVTNYKSLKINHLRDIKKITTTPNEIYYYMMKANPNHILGIENR